MLWAKKATSEKEAEKVEKRHQNGKDHHRSLIKPLLVTGTLYLGEVT
jgi:hypothetical protein